MVGYNDQSDYGYTAVSNLTTNQTTGLKRPAYAYHTHLKNTHFSYSTVAPSTALKNSSIPIPMSEDTPTACKGGRRMTESEEGREGGECG